MQSLIRKIEDSFTQATSGNIAKTIQFSADYGLSRALTLRAFYDLQINEPLISNASYPTSNPTTVLHYGSHWHSKRNTTPVPPGA